MEKLFDTKGTWYLEFELEVSGEDAIGDPTGGVSKVRLCIGSGQSPAEAAVLGEALWKSLSSEILEKRLKKKFDDEDYVVVRSPRIVWLGKRNKTRRTLRSGCW